MSIRTTLTTISFRFSFNLACIAEALPAGDYQLEADEELVEGTSNPTYRRIATFLHVPRGSGKAIFPIDPKELEAALVKDLGTEQSELQT
jgi:hypothetical protein